MWVLFLLAAGIQLSKRRIGLGQEETGREQGNETGMEQAPSQELGETGGCGLKR